MQTLVSPRRATSTGIDELPSCRADDFLSFSLAQHHIRANKAPLLILLVDEWWMDVFYYYYYYNIMNLRAYSIELCLHQICT